MDPTFEDAIGADLLVPARNQQGGEDGGASLVAILADLADFAALRFTQRRHCPVIDDQNIETTQSCQEVA
jgi:hypothetical protein